MLPVIYEFTLPYLLVKSSLWVFEFSAADYNFHTQKKIVLKWKSHILQNFGPDLKQNVLLSDLNKVNYKTSAQIPLFF